METWIIICLIIAWYLSGVGSFIFWWTKQFDFTTKEVGIMIWISLAGPFMFFLGWAAHCDSNKKVLIKRRR